MIRYERYGFIGHPKLNMIREFMGHDRTGRPVYRHVADCETEADAKMIVDSLASHVVSERHEAPVQSDRFGLKSEL